jgi:hypothetical protein
MQMLGDLCIRALLVLAFLAVPALAVADPITFLFTGNVTFVSPELSGRYNTSQTLSGFYAFESTQTDLFTDPTFPTSAFSGLYRPTELSFTLGDETVIIGQDLLPSIVVNNDLPQPFPSGPPRDTYGVNADAPVHNADGTVLNRIFSILLQDFDATAFDNDALPLSPPNLSSFDANDWILGGFVGPRVVGHITSLTLDGSEVHPVPEPATLLLLGSSLAGLAGFRRKRLRQSGSS